MNRRKWLKLFLILLAVLILFGVLEYRGVIWHNNLFANKYKVRGIDVSHYQYQVDWKKVAEKDKYQFAYSKATEGQNYTDSYLEENWRNAQESGLLVGAYHFFTTQSTGKQQAEHFIETVPNIETSLPPVIDIEIATNKDVQQIQKEITDMSESLEGYYHQKPILYVTYDTYNEYIKGEFADYDIWIRDILKRPKLKGQREWTLWQFNNRGRIPGIKAYVDINVFNGDQAEFDWKFKHE
ncbi:GH25 family lysozyme [Cohnella sp. AR92]|uniref:glycoside hydrolase family 25 protein n=1 Tax=Cohnella sp. AR92 TaxID=648716 RepID=UPI000F8EB19D|nr:GH25 family lysozyme [Cohnella sp. AR92]RUS45842.1 glycoside hydrolase [Cohnella sp. AR92]